MRSLISIITIAMMLSSGVVQVNTNSGCEVGGVKGCTQTGEHYHNFCGIEGCTRTEEHYHNFCGIEGCTQTEEHYHNFCGIKGCARTEEHYHSGHGSRHHAKNGCH